MIPTINDSNNFTIQSPYSYSQPIYTEVFFDTKIRKTENGYLLLHKNKEYVFESIESLKNYLTKIL